MAEVPKFSGQDEGTFVPDVAARRAGVTKRRDVAIGGASELARGVAEIQAERYQTAILDLMRRSADSPELANALTGFLVELEHCAVLGDRQQALSKGRVDYIVEAIAKASEVLAPRNHGR